MEEQDPKTSLTELENSVLRIKKTLKDREENGDPLSDDELEKCKELLTPLQSVLDKYLEDVVSIGEVQ